MALLRVLKLHAAALIAAAVLSSCGGGFYLSIGEDDPYAPDVNLAADATSGQAGQSVRLVAAAADESGIAYVAFFRYDGNTAVQVGSDTSAPYESAFVLPADGRSSVTVFAHAVDLFGNAADSPLLTIAIVP